MYYLCPSNVPFIWNFDNEYIDSNGGITYYIGYSLPGIYSVTITEVSSCGTATSSDTVIILGVDISANVPCNDTNGTIDITVSGGSGSYYSWSDGSTDEDLSNLNNGEYFVTVTDN